MPTAHHRKNVQEDVEVDLHAVLESSDSSDESDVSEYGNKKKRTSRTKKSRKGMRKRERTPTPPAMSDIEYDKDSRSGSPELGDCIEVGRPIHSQKSTTTPNVVQIHLDAGAVVGAVINLNLSDILGMGIAASSSDSLTTSAAPNKRIRLLHNANSITMERKVS